MVSPPIMRNNPREFLLSVHRQHVKAWEQKNLEDLRSLYAEEAIIFNTSPPARFSDFKTFENNLKKHFSQIREVSILTSNIQIEVHGEVACVTSQYLMAYHRNEDLFRQNGRWTEIYRQDKDDRDWKLIHFHSSPDPADHL